MKIVIMISAKVIMFIKKVGNKIISLYQLSQIPHGKNCEIRGGGVDPHFKEILLLVTML